MPLDANFKFKENFCCSFNSFPRQADNYVPNSLPKLQVTSKFVRVHRCVQSKNSSYFNWQFISHTFYYGNKII